MAPARSFTLPLPPSYPIDRILGYLGRDADSLTVQVDGQSFVLGLWIGEVPAVLRVDLAAGEARARLEARRRLPEDAEAQARDHLRRLLGLHIDPEPFERHVSASPRLAPLVAGRLGLRIPQTPDPFDGLTWVILGQQITLAFAYTLKRRLVERAGTPVPGAPGGLFAPPTAEKVANLDVEELMAIQFSRRKAEYVTGAARLIVAGGLDLDRLATAPPAEVEATLLAVRGLGPWSAHYLMMRAFGFEDCVPVGDSGLVRGLMKFFALPDRPGPAATQELMRPFAPYRSWATFHLWQSLKDES
jgi:AraC family transcriptional regulator, regulatory protein of adaptative response / DNA-3-methyladenine glycosylase II